MEIIPSDDALATILTWLGLKNKTVQCRSSAVHVHIYEILIEGNVTTEITTSSE